MYPKSQRPAGRRRRRMTEEEEPRGKSWTEQSGKWRSKM